MSLLNHKLIQSKYGVSRFHLMEYLSSFKVINPEVIKSGCLQTYKIFKWSASYLDEKLSDNFVQGSLIRFNKPYLIVWKTPRGNLLDAIQKEDNNKQYYLSFREAAPEYNLPAYVLIWEVK